MLQSAIALLLPALRRCSRACAVGASAPYLVVGNQGYTIAKAFEPRNEPSR
jgi:hypothetical protein